MNTFPYLYWVRGKCDEANIRIIGEITPVKDNKLVCIPSVTGNLLLKKTGTFIVDELKFMLNLLNLGLINKPELIGYDRELKLALMRDMGGEDLSALPALDIETARNVLTSLADMQLASVKHVKSKEITGVDYRIDAMLRELNSMPETVYKMLSGTRHNFTENDLEKLTNAIKHIIAVLKPINGLLLPDTLHHGDLGAYNVRITGKDCIFYDWGCGGVSQPFFDTCRLLSHNT
jgi:hypothetical protein